MVIAGAGSGKTKMLTSRMAYLISEKRVPGHQILAVTFTNKAAAEMRERVDRYLGESSTGAFYSGPEIGTFHSICLRILRRELANTPFTQSFVIYDDSDQLSLIKSVVSKLNIDDKTFSPKSFQYKINALKCEATGPEELEPSLHNLFDRHLKRVYEQYQKDLFTNNAIDFGEIITLTYRLLRDHPEVRARLQARYRYIHVDEYQDTNRAQYLLLSQLASRQSGGHENICVVGDEDQSIYGWRGADINNILDFENEYPNARVVKLEQNYRSTKNIINAAGQVIRNNKTRKDKTLWTENEEGTQLIRAQMADERSEAEFVVSEIKRRCIEDNRAYTDFAILYRTHAQSRPFEDSFRREKISYSIFGGLKFYDRKEIKDVLAYFRAIMNPSDSISVKRVINVPARGIGKTTIEKIEDFHNQLLAQHPEGVSFWEALTRFAEGEAGGTSATLKKLTAFTGLMDRLKEAQPKLLLSELYHQILDETGYVRELKTENTDEAKARIENLEEFDRLLLEFEEDSLGQDRDAVLDEAGREKRALLLEQFLELSMLGSEVEPGAQKDQDQQGIKMMTLHACKGLEFPVVFLVGMEEGLFPSVRAWEEGADEDIEEERRLCYVGMTRAREQLIMTSAMIRRIWGQVNYQEPARFFQEMEDELIDFRDFTHGSQNPYRTGSSRTLGYGGNTLTSSGSSVGLWGGGVPSVSNPASETRFVGLKVDHPDYGPAKVIQIEGSGQDARVTLEFREGGRKKFLYRFIQGILEDAQ